MIDDKIRKIFPWNPKDLVLRIRDAETIADLHNQSVQMAKELTKNNPELFKTTYQCIFWEACHFVFGLKLADAKKNPPE